MSRLTVVLCAGVLAVAPTFPADSTSLALKSASVLADGRILRLEFAGPLPAARSLPDSQPGVALSLSSGARTEYIGSWVLTKNNTLTWVASYLLTSAGEVVTVDAAPLSISAPAGLLEDDRGNATGRFAAFKVANGSLVDEDGFTARSLSPPEPGSRTARGGGRSGTSQSGGTVLYVSSSHGSDSHSFPQAMNPRTPLASIPKALELLHTNKQNGKWTAIRLLRGDVFDSGGQIKIGGRDAHHPFVIEDYWFDYGGRRKKDPGTRPVIALDASAAKPKPMLNAQGGGSTPDTLHHTVIRRIRIAAVNWTGGADHRVGFGYLKAGSNLTLDDCEVTNFGLNLSVQGKDGGDGRLKGLNFLRCIVTDARLDGAALPYGVSGCRSQAAYIEAVDDLLISQCVFDNNGRTSADRTGRNVFSHNLYLSHINNGPATVWGNVMRASGSHGIQMRAGGVLAYNYFGRNALASELATPGGSQYKNVIELAENISSAKGGERGVGIIATNEYGPIEGQSIEFNIVVHTLGSYPQGIILWQVKGFDYRMREVRVRNNTLVRAGPFAFFEGVSPPRSPIYDRVIVERNLIDTGPERPYSVEASLGKLSFTNWDWYKADHNAVASTSERLPRWITLTHTEAHSLHVEPIYVNGQANIGSYAAKIGKGSEEEFIAALRTRPPGTFDAENDVLAIYRYFASQYTPTNLPPLGRGPFDYFGAVDYRKGKAAGKPRTKGGS
jgi:hypothetical protein